jgi:hypothetical protein
MRKKTFFILITLSIFILVYIFICLLNPLRKSEEKIKESILKLTPVGTSLEDVIKIIENNKKWETRYISYEDGYLDPKTRAVVGEKSIRAFVGEYRNFFVTSVSVFWGFDEDSKLIEICIWKDEDSL